MAGAAEKIVLYSLNTLMPILPSEVPALQRGPISVIGVSRSATFVLHWILVQHKNFWESTKKGFPSMLIEGAENVFASDTKFGEYHWRNENNI